MSFIAACREQVDLVFILDASGSIQAHNFNIMKQFVADFVEEIDVDTGGARIALISYSNNVRREFDLNTYDNRRDIINAVMNVPYIRGTTNTASALQYIRTEVFQQARGDRPGARNVAFLITDGQSNDNRQTLVEARRAKDADIHIFVAGIGEYEEYSDKSPTTLLFVPLFLGYKTKNRS